MTAMCKRYPFIATMMECAASTKHGLFVFPRNGRCGERQFVKPNHVVYWLQQQVSMRYRIKGIPGSSGPESLTGVPLLQGVPSATWHKHPERWGLRLDRDPRGWHMLRLDPESVAAQLAAFGHETDLRRRLENTPPEQHPLLVEQALPLLGEWVDPDLLALVTTPA